jgi:D-amino-acid oxidase
MKLRKQTANPRVLVLGAGVSGLTTALCLARQGYGVTIVAERFAPQVTSVVAGALWEWPPAVCGHHHGQASLARSKKWCAESYQVFGALAANPATGVFLRPVTFYFRRPVAEDPVQRKKMNELRREVGRFKHDANLIAEHGVNPELELRDAYTHLAPMIDTDVYLGWLLDEARRLACRILKGKIVGRLRAHEGALAREFEADAIVNCCGMGAQELTDDPLYPLRGALIRVRNDGRAFPKITEAHCVSRTGSMTERGFIFIVPRGRDMLILGGLAEPNEWSVDIGLHNHEPIRTMYQRCLEFMPALRDAEIDAAEPVRVGIRPARRQSVRLEREPGSRIVHNYGHGGSGVTFSWGCATEVCAQIQEHLAIDGQTLSPALPCQAGNQKRQAIQQC